MPRVRIFQVGYDESLLRVRTEMLKHAGFDVRSALGNAEAERTLADEPDCALVLIGWSGSDRERGEIVRSVKQRWPAMRVIALHRAGGKPIPEADFNTCSDNPEEWFAAVRKAATA